jgi:prepilin-type processing-associated H-X9-DG protein
VALYPEYASDPKIWRCPSDPDSLDLTEALKTVLENAAPYQSNPSVYKYLYDTMLRMALHANSYIYWGWVAMDNYDMLACYDFSKLAINAVAPGKKAEINLGGPFNYLYFTDMDIDWSNPAAAGIFSVHTWPDYVPDPTRCGSGSGSTSYRIREGVERFLITDINNPASAAVAQSTVPVMFDNFSWFSYDVDGVGSGKATANFNHLPGGSNVLYMDGHVEFRRYTSGAGTMSPDWMNANDNFPMTSMVAYANGMGYWVGTE